MSLQFVFGPSGYGKSEYVQNLATEEASKNRQVSYLMIVPDQFTMQTQMDMAGRNPDGGILNIDVLSFGRLTHRIFEEVGKPERVMLDDLGKCLILRRVIHANEENLKVLRKGIHTPGYVQEVKSVLSEFMQYGIRPEDLSKKIDSMNVNPGLKYKLGDFQTLYEAFLKELKKQYTTKEDTLYCLCERIPLSKQIPKSVLIFDGFTGFTPIQISVIMTLLNCAKKVIVTLPLGSAECCEEELYNEKGLSDLFRLTKKTVADITKASKEAGIAIEEPVFLRDGANRFGQVPAISFLEKNLYRTKEAQYSEIPEEITIAKAADETHECMLLCRTMTELIRQKGYRYRDMAVICGDLPSYSRGLKLQFEKYGIPYFMDATTELIRHPFVSYIRTILSAITQGYDYREMNGIIRSAFTDLTKEEADILDNYCVAKNIRGYSAWKKDFTASTDEMRRKTKGLDKALKEEKIRSELEIVNAAREKVIRIFEPFVELPKDTQITAKDYLTALYKLLCKQGAAARLNRMAEEYEEEGKPEKALEYSQVYKTVMKLFDQVVSLIGDEAVTLEDLIEVLDVGFGEIRIGIIPKSVDVLPVCDLIRSRFGKVKALFFIGVNDGNIPAVGAGGGLISDMERSMLIEQGLELAPSRAMESFTEQLYLYQILTKPEEKLCLSFLSVDGAGESRKASVLIDELCKLFPKLSIQDEALKNSLIDAENMAETLRFHNILSTKDLKAEFATRLGEYARGAQDENATTYVKKLFALLKADEENAEWLEQTVEDAFLSYRPKNLSEGLLKKIYGDIMECSVSSLEKFAGCAYAHFLRYGLMLREREDADIYSADLGNITHEALEVFGKYLKENGEEFAKVSEERCSTILDEITDELMKRYDEGLFVEAEGSEYLSHQVKRVLKRSVSALKTQLLKGSFAPVSYEQEFKRLIHEADTMLVGKIDRIDACLEDDKAFVKIVDYKSGSKDFEEELFAQGVQLQTAVYLSEALKRFAQEYPDKEIIPSAMFYFRMQDPYLEVATESEEEQEKNRNILLRPTGIMVGDSAVLDRLEAERTNGKSEAIPVSFGKDGALSSRGCKAAKTAQEMKEILQSADDKVVSLAGEISQGKIDVSPLIFDKYDACKYCAYKTACGFDERISGYARRVPEGAQDAAEEDE